MAATRLRRLAQLGGGLKKSAKARSAVSVAASCAERPYSAVRRARRASGSSGMVGEDLLLPLRADDERRKVGLGEVAVVVGLFFGAHGVRAALGAVPEARLLHDAAAVFDDADLALDLVLDRGADVAEAVDVFDFGLGAELFAPLSMTLTLASQRREPSSMLQSETPV